MFVDSASFWVSVTQVTALFLHRSQGGDNARIPHGRGRVTGCFPERREGPPGEDSWV